MVDILIVNGTLITLDPERRIIEDGALAISGTRIAEIGPSADLRRRFREARIVDASGKVIMPGLIDCHAHAGHGLVKTMGGGDAEAWFEACERIYTTGSGVEFWRAEAALSALERLKCGTTCGVSLLGGGADIMRTDDPVYGDAHCEANRETGIRSVLAVGPCRPPFPKQFHRWTGTAATPCDVDFRDQLATSEALAAKWHTAAEGRIRVSTCLPVYFESDLRGDPGIARQIREQTAAFLDLTRRRGLRLTQDGHRRGSIDLANREFGLLGPDAYFSHCIDLTEREIALCRETGTSVVHNPSAIMSIRGRCPVPELIDAGVTVALGSDGTAPDRSFDMFRHMFQCMHYHRTHFRDADVLPPGKAIEMVTIDAAKAIGLEAEIGSLEVGKRADVIMIDMMKPHLFPRNMPAYRVACFANGADVDTVIVDGRILMEGRKVLSVNEASILDRAQAEALRMIERTGLQRLLDTREGFWGQSRYLPAPSR